MHPVLSPHRQIVSPGICSTGLRNLFCLTGGMRACFRGLRKKIFTGLAYYKDSLHMIEIIPDTDCLR